MKYRVVKKNGKYHKKLVLEWHEKFAFVVIIPTPKSIFVIESFSLLLSLSK